MLASITEDKFTEGGGINPAYVAQLEAAAARLDATLRAPDNPLVLPDGIVLTPKQEEVFRVIMARAGQYATKDMIWAALYAGSKTGAPDRKIIDVLVSKMRARLKSWDLIETVYGKGYRVRPEFLPALKGEKPWKGLTQ